MASEEAALSLRVTIVQAEGLPKMDLLGHADGFCTVWLRSSKQRHRTTFVRNDAAPIWDETFSLGVPSKGDGLIVDLYDKDNVSHNDRIGTVEIPTGALVRGEESTQWYDVVPKAGPRPDAPIRIRIRIAWDGQQAPLPSPPPSPPPGRPGEKKKPKPFAGAVHSPA
jgi:hypothetical protein